MSSFGRSAWDAIDRELVPMGFRVARQTYAAFFVPAVRRETNEVALYLYVRDSRRGSGGLRGDLWCAPIDCPDDRLDRLGVGFKVFLHQSWDEPEGEFLNATMARARTLAQHSSSLVQAVEKELARPSPQTKRFPIWCAERALLRVASRTRDLAQDYETLAHAAVMANRGRSGKEVYRAAQALVAKAKDVPALQGAIASLPTPDQAFSTLAEQVRIQMLLERP